MSSLKDFASKNERRHGFQAWIESIPEWDEILKAWRAGVEAGAIRKWLIEDKGYDPSVATAARVNQQMYKKYPRGKS